MNDVDGPWVELEKLELFGLPHGVTRVVADVHIGLEGFGTGNITVSFEVRGDAALQAIERAALDRAAKFLAEAARIPSDRLEVLLRSCREEDAELRLG